MCLCRCQSATVTCAEGTVMGTAYPIGYGTARVSLDEMKRQMASRKNAAVEGAAGVKKTI